MKFQLSGKLAVGIATSLFALTLSSISRAAPPTTRPTTAETMAFLDEIDRKAKELDLKDAGNFMLIASLNGSAESLGLQRDDLQTKVELELRRAGIPFNPPKLKDVRFLSVNLSTVGDEKDAIIGYAISVSLHEQVLSIRKGLTAATTWESSSFGTIGRARTNELYSTVVDHIQRFANAYLTSNPVRQSTPSDQNDSKP